MSRTPTTTWWWSWGTPGWTPGPLCHQSGPPPSSASSTSTLSRLPGPGSWRTGNPMRSGTSWLSTMLLRHSSVAGCSRRAGLSLWRETTTGTANPWTTPTTSRRCECWAWAGGTSSASLLTSSTPSSSSWGRSSTRCQRCTWFITAPCPGSPGGGPGL